MLLKATTHIHTHTKKMDNEPENEVKSRESGDKVTAERVQHAEHHVWFSHTHVICLLSCCDETLMFATFFVFPLNTYFHHISYFLRHSPPLLVSLQTYFTGSRLGQVVTVLRGGQRAKRGRRGVCVSVFSVHFQSEQLTRLPASWCVVRSAEGLTLLFQFFLKLNLHQIIKPLMKIYPEHINKENSVPSCHHFLQDAMG